MQEGNKIFRNGEIVFAKILGYPWWPAMISTVNNKDKPQQYRVDFFGDNPSHAFLPTSKIIRFDEYSAEKARQKKARGNAGLKRAIQLANKYNDRPQQSKASSPTRPPTVISFSGQKNKQKSKLKQKSRSETMNDLFSSSSQDQQIQSQKNKKHKYITKRKTITTRLPLQKSLSGPSRKQLQCPRRQEKKQQEIQIQKQKQSQSESQCQLLRQKSKQNQKQNKKEKQTSRLKQEQRQRQIEQQSQKQLKNQKKQKKLEKQIKKQKQKQQAEKRKKEEQQRLQKERKKQINRVKNLLHHYKIFNIPDIQIQRSPQLITKLVRFLYKFFKQFHSKKQSQKLALLHLESIKNTKQLKLFMIKYKMQSQQISPEDHQKKKQQIEQMYDEKYCKTKNKKNDDFDFQ